MINRCGVVLCNTCGGTSRRDLRSPGVYIRRCSAALCVRYVISIGHEISDSRSTAVYSNTTVCYQTRQFVTNPIVLLEGVVMEKDNELLWQRLKQASMYLSERNASLAAERASLTAERASLEAEMALRISAERHRFRTVPRADHATDKL